MSHYVAESVRQRVRAVAHDRCGYCLSQQRYLYTPLEIEHIIPLVLGGKDEESNLWMACSRCNRFKGPQIEARDPVTGQIQPLYNPRQQPWQEHFRWDAGGVRVKGLTPVGRATIEALQLNHEQAVAVRRNWVAAGWHPPGQ